MSTQYWIPGSAGDWSDATDWQSGVAPGSGDSAVINDSNAVTVTGSAVANSLALNNSTLTVSGSLTLATTLNITGNSSGFLKLSGGALSAQTITSGSGTGGTSGYLWGYGAISGAVNGNVAIVADGGDLKVQGSLAGETGIVMIYQGATLELSNATSQYIDFNGTTATLKLDAPAAFTGSLTGIAVGDTIDLAGIVASSAAYSDSTLTINETDGKSLVYANVSANVAGEPVTVASDNNGGTLVYWTLPPESWIPGSAGDWSDATDWQSGVAPGSGDSAVINDSNAVTVTGSAVANSLALNNSTLTVSGSLTLATTLNITGNSSGFLKLSGGALSAQTITSGSGTGGTSGYLWGYGAISGAVNGNVAIVADGGDLKVQGSLAGETGIVMIYQGATLELSNATSQYIDFNGTTATLKLDAPAAFTGSLTGIAVGDTIDLAGIVASSAAYSDSTLTINETDGKSLVYANVSANVAGEPVTVASDNNGGTLVYWTLPPESWIPGSAGDWSDATDWQSGVAPGSGDSAVINDSNAVTVTGSAVANSLALNNSTLTVSGSLTLATTLNITGNSSGFLKLSGGALSAQTITSGSGTGGTSGYLWGYGAISGAVNGNVAIVADGGDLKVQGSLAGETGIVMIYQGATLELSNATSQYIDFNGTTATLKLDAPAAFTGSLTGIAVGDTIDLAGIVASSAAYSDSTLTINETDGKSLVYANVSANVAGEPVTVASDNNGGTLVYWTLPPESWIPGSAGDWSDATDWQSGVAPGSGDSAVINDSNAVTVTGSAVANSLALNNSTLTVSGSLTLATTLNITGNSSGFLKLSGGALSAQTITSGSGTGGTSGYLWGYGAISGAVNGNVAIVADGGDLKVQGSLAGDTGIVMIYQGATLELSNATSQYIDFNGTTATLKLDAPAAFTGSLTGIAVGDTIDLAGIVASSAAYSDSTLTINETDGKSLVYANVSANVAGEPVTVASDNNGGTLVYWGRQYTVAPPTITGALAKQATSSETPIKPFADVTIGDDNANSTETLMITLSGDGVLTGAGLPTSGAYTLTGTAAQVTSALEALLFVPAVGQPGTNSTTTFTLSDTSSAYATPTVDTTTSVVDTDMAVPPTITGALAKQATSSETPIKPFADVTIGDDNANSTETLMITLSGDGVLTGAGLPTSGAYTLTGTAAQVTSALEALLFVPAVGQPGTNSTTTFTLSDTSSAYATPTVDTTTSVVDTDMAVPPTITGALAKQATSSETPIKPFADVTIGDDNANSTETLMITLSGDGVLTGAGLPTSGAYTLTGTAAQVTSALEALLFVPAVGQPGTDSTTTFTLSDTSSAYATPTVDTTTSVVDTDMAVPPTITGALAKQATSSETPIKPFADVTIGDDNANSTETLMITLSGDGVLTGAGLPTSGAYTLTGTAAQVTSALEALLFVPAVGQPGTDSTTTFTLSDTSSAYATPTVDTTTSVVDTDMVGTGTGDVHIVTFQGLHYDFQAVGDFTLETGTTMANPFDIQVRTSSWASMASVTTEIAAQVGASAVQFNLDGTVSLNGIVDSYLGSTNATQDVGGGTISRTSPNSFSVSWDSGETLAVTNAGTYFNESLTLGVEDGPGSVKGLLGADQSQATDIQLNDGTVLSSPTESQLLGIFAQSWSVSDNLSLFSDMSSVPIGMADPDSSANFLLAHSPTNLVVSEPGNLMLAAK